MRLTKTIVTYHLSDFAVDVGSLLGFWLGVSVFGLTDLLETLSMLVQKLLFLEEGNELCCKKFISLKYMTGFISNTFIVL